MTVFDRAAAEIDLGVIAGNLNLVRERAGTADVMAVVKADAYGHGMVPVARQARASGIAWLGVALPSEALALRAAGDTGRILAWLWTPGDSDVAACVAQGIDLSVSSRWTLDEVVAAATTTGVAAKVHVKIDSGLSRNGITVDEWPALIPHLGAAVADGTVVLEALWSHLADGDVPGSSTVADQRGHFDAAVSLAKARGLDPARLHLGNSGTLFAHPDTRLDLVRVGIAMYGLTPHPALGSARELGLVPAMTLTARLANVKPVAAGTRVSYGGTWTAAAHTTLGLVPVGYADGIPRSASSRGEVSVGGRRATIAGCVAMDQFVIDLGPESAAAAGDVVHIFGPGQHGEPTADDWAQMTGSIGYEIVTRLGPRVPRRYLSSEGAG